ncbi:hypothetical protein [Okeania sp. KiyG1]|uniref:hypothetical protein n=1 Tax=Okeania sp. KiyG1 TaxID=2720165 RepID=UPI001F1E1338|nr:hypothetical protein [Okeania sp. KiyG1]
MRLAQIPVTKTTSVGAKTTSVGAKTTSVGAKTTSVGAKTSFCGGECHSPLLVTSDFVNAHQPQTAFSFDVHLYLV